MYCFDIHNTDDFFSKLKTSFSFKPTSIILNSSQVKNKYIFSQSYHSECFSKDENYAESQHFLWPFNYIQNDSKMINH